MRLSILIVNWNTREQVEACLDSIMSNPPDFEYEIIVVDNASSDGSAELLSARAGQNSRIKFIASGENLGFARGNNRAYEDSSGDYVLLLNPDTKVKPGALDSLVGYLDGRGQAGIVGPKLLNPDGSIQPSVRRFPDLKSMLLVSSSLHRLFRPVWYRRYTMEDFDYDREAEVDQVMGAALLTRRAIIEELGLFDENFYLWFEEVDFCRRVKDKNWKIVYYPKAEVFHEWASAFSQLNVLRRKSIFFRSILYYFKKNGKGYERLVLYLFSPIAFAVPLLIVAVNKLFGIKGEIKKV